MANNTVSFKLKIVDEATGSIKKVTASTNELRGVVQKVTDEVRRASPVLCPVVHFQFILTDASVQSRTNQTHIKCIRCMDVPEKVYTYNLTERLSKEQTRPIFSSVVILASIQ